MLSGVSFSFLERSFKDTCVYLEVCVCVCEEQIFHQKYICKILPRYLLGPGIKVTNYPG